MQSTKFENWIYPQLFKNTSAVLQGGMQGSLAKYFLKKTYSFKRSASWLTVMLLTSLAYQLEISFCQFFHCTFYSLYVSWNAQLKPKGNIFLSALLRHDTKTSWNTVNLKASLHHFLRATGTSLALVIEIVEKILCQNATNIVFKHVLLYTDYFLLLKYGTSCSLKLWAQRISWCVWPPSLNILKFYYVKWKTSHENDWATIYFHSLKFYKSIHKVL